MFFYLAFLVFHVCKYTMKKKTYFFEKNSGDSRFVTLPMKVIEKRKLHPGNSGNLCYTHLKFYIFSWSPLDACTYYFFNAPGNSMPSTSCFFF